jgi:hypothetical protein
MLICLARGRGPTRLALALCLFSTIAFAARAVADPRFTDPEVTAYVKALGQFRDRYLDAVKAARHGDDRGMKRMDAELPAWQEKAIRLLDKLEPGETKRFTEYVTQCGQTMMDAAYGFSNDKTRFR